MTNSSSPAWYFYIGLLAAVCIAVYMLPQLIKTIKTKDTSGISIVMFIIALVGDLFFTIQGIAILATTHDVSSGLPIFLANFLALIISAIIAFFKFRNMHMAKYLNMTEKDFCSNYKNNVEVYKRNFGKKPVSSDAGSAPIEQ